MKEVDRMKLLKAPIARAFVTAGLVGTMAVQGAISPLAAAAVEVAADGSAATDTSVAVDTSFSNATQRLIAASQNKVQISLDEAAKLLAQVQAAANAAKGADDKQAQAMATARQAVIGAEAGAQAATTDRVNELQSQVDALNQQLADAQKAVNDLNAQKGDAEDEIKTLNDALEALEQSGDVDAAVSDAAQFQEELDALTAAKDALDKANSELEQGKTDLDEAEAAKSEADKAVADQQAVVDKLKSELDAVKKQLDDKGLELSDYNDAKAAYEQAQSDYDAALANKTAAEQKAAAAQNAIDEATAKVNELNGTIPGLQAAASDAASKVDAAQSDYDSALATYNELLAQAGSAEGTTDSSVDENGDPVAPTEPPAVSDSELSDAKSALDAAASMLETAKTNKANADLALQQAITESNTAESTRGTAETELATANATLAQANAGLSVAETTRDSAKSAYEKAKSDNEQTLNEYNAAKSAYDTAKSAYDEGVQTYNTLQEQATNAYDEYVTAKNNYDSLKNQSDGATEEYNVGLVQFVVHINEIQALGCISHATTDAVLGSYLDEKDLSEKSVFNLGNLQKALDLVKLVNDYRVENGLDEFFVNPTLIAIGMMNTAYSDVVHDHSNAPAWQRYYISENLAWTGSAQDAFDQWVAERNLWEGKYASYKADFDAAVARGGNMAFSTAVMDLMNNHYDVYEQVGHYLNIINPDMKGIGVGHVNNTWEMCTNSADADVEYTYDQFVKTFNDYLAANSSSSNTQIPGDLDSSDTDDKLAEAERIMNQKLQAYQNINTQLTAQQNENDKNKAAMESAQEKLDEIGDVTGITTTIANLEKAYNDAESALASAKTVQAAAKSDAEAKQLAFNTAKSDAEAKALAVAEAKSKAESALGEVNRLQGEYDAAYQKYQELLAAHGDDSAVLSAYNAALGKYNEFVKALNDKKAADAELETAKSALAEQNGIITEKTTERNAQNGVVSDFELNVIPAASARVASTRATFDSLDSAKQISDKYDAELSNLDSARQTATDAEDALETATAELDTLTSARAEAKATADKAQENLVSAIEAAIETNQGLIADVEAKLPAAEKKVASWKAVFAQQNADSIVTDGFDGTTDDADISNTLAGAHSAYDEKVQALAAAKARVEEAQAALEQTKADKTATEQDLADKLAELAVAQDAYDKLKAELTPAENQQTMQQVGSHFSQAQGTVSVGQATSESAMPQTGDSTALAVTGLAIAGAVAVAGGEFFRRRRN